MLEHLAARERPSRLGRHLWPMVVLLLAACGADSSNIESAFIWRLDVGGQPSFLFGTIHVGVEAEELPGAVWEAFEGASVFVAESNIVDSPSAEEIEQAFALPVDVELEQLLSPEVWERLLWVLPGMPEEQLQQTHPWLLQTALQQSLLPEQLSMDEAFTRRAQQAGKSVEFLETFDDFGDVMRALSLEESAASLESVLRDPDGFLAAVEGLVALYRTGDVRAVRLGLYGAADDLEASESDELLLKRRNEAWFPALEGLVRRGGAFVAVGLGHLVGPDNLLDMFASKGILAQRVAEQADSHGENAVDCLSCAVWSPSPARMSLKSRPNSPDSL